VLIVAGIIGYGLLRKPQGAPLLPPLLKKRQRRVRASG
jgi:hypothetical protein